MTTTKEFKTLHGLSDSAFNRLTNKIKADFPDQELTRRVNSRDWKIIDVALFEQYLSYQKREASVTPQPEAPQATVAAIPTVEFTAIQPIQFPQPVSQPDSDRFAITPIQQQNNLAQVQANSQAVEQITALANQVIAGVRGYRENLDLGTEETRRAAEKLRLTEFELQAEVELTQQAEIRAKVQQQQHNQDLGKSSSNVINLMDRLKKRVQS